MRINAQRMSALVGLTAMAATVVTGVIAAPASAADPYNVTVAGVPGNTPLVALPPSSVQPVVVSNLPPNVGVNIIHCKTPSDPSAPPTLCDNSTGAVNVVAGDPAGRASTQVTVKINAEFFGMNPNPTGTPTAPASVNCRAPSSDPHASACTLYVLGSGKDNANPAYMRVWPTLFSPVSGSRRTDTASILLSGKTVTGPSNKLVMNAATPFTVTMQSGLIPTLSSDKCSLTAGKITALASTGTCTVLITTTGGKNYKPFVGTQVFQLVLS